MTRVRVRPLTAEGESCQPSASKPEGFGEDLQRTTTTRNVGPLCMPSRVSTTNTKSCFMRASNTYFPQSNANLNKTNNHLFCKKSGCKNFSHSLYEDAAEHLVRRLCNGSTTGSERLQNCSSRGLFLVCSGQCWSKVVRGEATNQSGCPCWLPSTAQTPNSMSTTSGNATISSRCWLGLKS